MVAMELEEMQRGLGLERAERQQLMATFSKSKCPKREMAGARTFSFKPTSHHHHLCFADDIDNWRLDVLGADLGLGLLGLMVQKPTFPLPLSMCLHGASRILSSSC